MMSAEQTTRVRRLFYAEHWKVGTIASELGLLGSTALLLVFLVFAYRGIKIALLAEDDASKLLAFGLTAMFAMQTLIIVGGVTKTIPLTGITLPFVSYGGSSVVGNFVLTGLLLVVSENAGKRSGAEKREGYDRALEEEEEEEAV